jgi:hypothetical protein
MAFKRFKEKQEKSREELNNQRSQLKETEKVTPIKTVQFSPIMSQQRLNEFYKKDSGETFTEMCLHIRDRCPELFKLSQILPDSPDHEITLYSVVSSTKFDELFLENGNKLCYEFSNVEKHKFINFSYRIQKLLLKLFIVRQLMDNTTHNPSTGALLQYNRLLLSMTKKVYFINFGKEIPGKPGLDISVGTTLNIIIKDIITVEKVLRDFLYVLRPSYNFIYNFNPFLVHKLKRSLDTIAPLGFQGQVPDYFYIVHLLRVGRLYPSFNAPSDTAPLKDFQNKDLQEKQWATYMREFEALFTFFLYRESDKGA